MIVRQRAVGAPSRHRQRTSSHIAFPRSLTQWFVSFPPLWWCGPRSAVLHGRSFWHSLCETRSCRHVVWDYLPVFFSPLHACILLSGLNMFVPMNLVGSAHNSITQRQTERFIPPSTDDGRNKYNVSIQQKLLTAKSNPLTAHTFTAYTQELAQIQSLTRSACNGSSVESERDISGQQ